MSWDWLISGFIIVGLVLAAWARVSRQTIPELLRGIKDMVSDKGEEVIETGVDIYE